MKKLIVFFLSVAARYRVMLISVLCSVSATLPHARILQEVPTFLADAMEVVTTSTGNPAASAALQDAFKILTCTAEKLYIEENVLQPELEHPLVMILKAAWPGVQGTFANWSSNEDMMQHVIGMLTMCLRNLDTRFGAFLPELLGTDGTNGLIIASLSGCVTASVLKHCSLIFMNFAGGKKTEPTYHPEVLGAFLNAVVVGVLGTFQSNFNEDPDVTQAFYDMLKDILRQNPQYLFSQVELSHTIFQAALAGLQCPEHKTYKSALLVIDLMLSEARKNECAGVILMQHGKPLLDAVLQGLGGAVDATLRPKTVEHTIYKLRIVAPQQTQVGCPAQHADVLALPRAPFVQFTTSMRPVLAGCVANAR